MSLGANGIKMGKRYPEFVVNPSDIVKQYGADTLRLYKVQSEFGLALDNRKPYTKSDWIVWSATLAETRGDFEALIAPLWKVLDESPSRVPFSDWYGVNDRIVQAFQARSVVGGVFIKLLKDYWAK